MNYIELTKIELESEKKMLEKYKEQVSRLPHRNMVCKEIRGKKRYYLSGDTTEYMPCASSELVAQIKRCHFANKAISILKTNITAQERLLRTYQPYDYVSINNLLPKVYRLDNPPLSSTPVITASTAHRTSFGLQVRSKSEAIIAEVLHARGLSFEYELPLRLQ